MTHLKVFSATPSNGQLFVVAFIVNVGRVFAFASAKVGV
jgi:hypothetical protein